MTDGNSRPRLSRLEILLATVLVLIIALCVYFANQSGRQRSEEASRAGDSSPGTDVFPAESGPGTDGANRGETGTNAALESSEFGERSRAIALPVTGGAIVY